MLSTCDISLLTTFSFKKKIPTNHETQEAITASGSYLIFKCFMLVCEQPPSLNAFETGNQIMSMLLYSL